MLGWLTRRFRRPAPDTWHPAQQRDHQAAVRRILDRAGRRPR